MKYNKYENPERTNVTFERIIEVFENVLLEETKINIIKENPYQNPPPYEKLIGDLSGSYSRRINIQHRLVYQVFEKEKTIKVIRLWTHYD